jgi:hypothetical protein
LSAAAREAGSFLMLTGAVFPLLPALSASLGLSKSMLTLTFGLADGAFP